MPVFGVFLGCNASFYASFLVFGWLFFRLLKQALGQVLMSDFLIMFIVGTGSAFAISILSGRTVLAVILSLFIFIMTVTLLNMRGGHFNEALQFGFGLAIFQSIPNIFAAVLGTLINSKSKIDKQ